jgi:hypothetical protein
MPDLTEEEYDALDELWTNNPPTVSGNGKSGFFMQHRGEIVLLDNVSAVWLRAKSEATHLRRGLKRSMSPLFFRISRLSSQGF